MMCMISAKKIIDNLSVLSFLLICYNVLESLSACLEEVLVFEIE